MKLTANTFPRKTPPFLCWINTKISLLQEHSPKASARLLAGRGELAAMLGLAGREILWSLVFVFPVYALFLWVFRRVPKKTVL